MSIKYYILTNAKFSDFFGVNSLLSGNPGKRRPEKCPLTVSLTYSSSTKYFANFNFIKIIIGKNEIILFISIAIK